MRLRTLIFFVTSRCNAKCRTCFYWQELNQRGDLSFEEIDTLTRTMPRFRELWLSGGEPMMRPALDEIVRMFYQRNGVRSINLPTNGLFRERLVGLLEVVSRELPGLKVNVNIALDGFAETHDRIRGVPGNFDKAIQTIEALYPLRERNPAIRIHVNSVITAENVDQMESLGWWLVRNQRLNGQYFQIVRGDPMDPSLKSVASADLAELYGHLHRIHEHYGRVLSQRHGGGAKGRLESFYYTRTLDFYHAIQHANLEQSSRWPMPCTAGQSILVIDYNGDVRACELRKKIANLRDVGCDFRRIFNSNEVRRETEQIVKDQCWCTHVCFIHDSARSSRRARFYQIPLGRQLV
jgi:MoaA/NifB/PqqE/SkfB family radical SAM enzyme